MAQRKPIVIDGETRVVPDKSTLSDVLMPDVQSVVTHGGALIPRAEFGRTPVPDGFETNLSGIDKG